MIDYQNTKAFTIWAKPYMTVYGFKHLDEGMQCHGFKFEVGKTYRHKGKLTLCESGFHFCRDLSKLIYYKDIFQGSTHFVRCRNVIGHSEDKECCSEITIGRALTFQEMMRYANVGYGNQGFGNQGNWNQGDSNKGDENDN